MALGALVNTASITYEGPVNAEWYTGVLEHAAIQIMSFLREVLAYFNRTMPSYILFSITTVWLSSKRVWALNWRVCSQDLSLIENLKSWSEKDNKEACWVAEILYQSRMGKNLLSKIKKVVSTVPKHTQRAQMSHTFRCFPTVLDSILTLSNYKCLENRKLDRHFLFMVTISFLSPMWHIESDLNFTTAHENQKQ